MSKLTTILAFIVAAFMIAGFSVRAYELLASSGAEPYVRGTIFGAVLLAMWGVVMLARAAWRASRRVGSTTVKRVSQALTTTRDA